MPRTLLAVPAAGLDLIEPLRAALAGTGPAVLPLPPDPAQAARVLAALRPDEPLQDDDIALVVPTSGSTGEPKGVLLPRSALLASAAGTDTRLGGPGRWLLAIPATHIGGLQVLIRSLLAGTEPVQLTGSFVEATAAFGPGRRYTSLVPTQLRRLLAEPETAGALAEFDAVLLGGAAAARPLLRAAAEAGVHVVTTYGMSETSGGCVYDGLALPGVRVELDDASRVVLAGPVVGRGYRLRPDLTAEVFSGGRFTTSDIGVLDGGRLTVLGRADDVVVTGGEKVAPAAVEAALGEHPAVADVAVVGVTDPEWGQRVVATVVLHVGTQLTLAEARDHVAARLSRVAAPRELRVVTALPLLPSGKLDRGALRSWS